MRRRVVLATSLMDSQGQEFDVTVLRRRTEPDRVLA
jgi:hypothetical protein